MKPQTHHQIDHMVNGKYQKYEREIYGGSPWGHIEKAGAPTVDKFVYVLNLIYFFTLGRLIAKLTGYEICNYHQAREAALEFIYLGQGNEWFTWEEYSRTYFLFSMHFEGGWRHVVASIISAFLGVFVAPLTVLWLVVEVLPAWSKSMGWQG